VSNIKSSEKEFVAHPFTCSSEYLEGPTITPICLSQLPASLHFTLPTAVVVLQEKKKVNNRK